jgi:predicted dehydrogenase
MTADEMSVAELLSSIKKNNSHDKRPLRLAIVGLGLIGRRHAAAIKQIDSIEICAVVDTDSEIISQATHSGVVTFSDLSDMIDTVNPDGIILATPTNYHVSQGLTCVEAGIPVLIEKPIADDVAEACHLVQQSETLNTAVMIGHHRRFNPIIQKAKQMLDAHEVGDIRVIDAKCWFYKPDHYFEIAPWRKNKGAGPVSINLVHDIDLLRYLCGDIIEVQAVMSTSARGFEVENVAAAIFRFENGAIGTISVSDSSVSPWSWEFTSGENPVYPFTEQSAYYISGSHAALAIPELTLWQHAQNADWLSPMSPTLKQVDMSDPLVNQLQHFAAVIRGEETAIVAAREGLQNLAVIEAMRVAAKTGRPVRPDAVAEIRRDKIPNNSNFNTGADATMA